MRLVFFVGFVFVLIRKLREMFYAYSALNGVQ